MNMDAPLGSPHDSRPLIAHVVFRFDVGGLENGVVNLINRLPAEAYRHAVISLTEITDFRERILRDDVQYFALAKKPGHGFRLYPRFFRLFRALAPDVVHTRNLAALEATLPAWLAGVPVRVHGEHGRDVGDLDGSNRTYRRIRRAYRPFVNQYVAVSKDLEQYLCRDIGVDWGRTAHICNGVDTSRFAPAAGTRRLVEGSPFNSTDHWLVGTVGRMFVASDVGGHHELVRDGETGFLFPAGDVTALAAAVERVLGGADRWPQIRAQARHFVETERTWARSVAGYANVYSSVRLHTPHRIREEVA